MSQAISSAVDFDSVYFAGATAVGCIAIAWGIIEPASVLESVRTIVSGTAGSIILHIGSELGYQYARHQGVNYLYRVSSEVAVGKTASVEEVYKRIQSHASYKPFMAIAGFEEKERVENLFKQGSIEGIETGRCMGTCLELVRVFTQPSQHLGPCPRTLSESFNLQNALFFQALYKMHCVIEGKMQKEPDIVECGGQVQKLIDAELFPLGYKVSDAISTSFSWKQYASALDLVAPLELASAQKPITAIMFCYPIPIGSAPGHAYFLHLFPDKFGFHDSICDESWGGFFEYSNKQEYFEELQARCIDLIGKDSIVQFRAFSGSPLARRGGKACVATESGKGSSAPNEDADAACASDAASSKSGSASGSN